MRTLPGLVLLSCLSCLSWSCSSQPQTVTPQAGSERTIAPEPPPPEPAAETLTADTPKTTIGGNTFIAPAGWTVLVRGRATILTAPEGDSRVALIDVATEDPDEAVARAWAAYQPDKPWPLVVMTPHPDKDGWSRTRAYEYRTSPNDKRDVMALARYASGTWTIAIYDMSSAVGEKRGAQVALIFGQLLPKGFSRESFAGKPAQPLDADRVASLVAFVETGRKLLDVPGLSFGLVQGGKVVFAGGFGVRALGKPAKVDADTRYLIASNTKALTTLMLAKLVDEGKLGWDTPAVSLLPSFALGDPDTTRRVLVKHLICACTGMPRQDLEWLFEYAHKTPASTLASLATMQPTSEFGALFQYSNPLAAAAGFLGGHVAFPRLELGKAYDEAMRTRVFAPLGMKSTTLDFAAAQKGNVALPHSSDADGKTSLANGKMNLAIIPIRPAGGVWSTVRDMLAYVQMELADGKLPDGATYVSREALLARRAPQVSIGQDTTYGMGLTVHTRYGVTVVNHGGDMIGYHSDMLWLPEQGVGAVVLTNGDTGAIIRSLFQRKLLEVLFDGKPEADADLAAAAKNRAERVAAERKQLEIPASAEEAGKLAATYTNAALGDLAVTRVGAATFFDFGEWKSEVASRKNPDGSASFVTITPGLMGAELVVGSGEGRTLVMRDAQHEYVFAAR